MTGVVIASGCYNISKLLRNLSVSAGEDFSQVPVFRSDQIPEIQFHEMKSKHQQSDLKIFPDGRNFK
jgi:predicted HAD superfamily hydrolase